MREKEPTKQAMYDWIAGVESMLETIRDHTGPLPDTSEGEWTDQHWAHVAHIADSVGTMAAMSSELHEGMLEILGAKMRLDAKLN